MSISEEQIKIANMTIDVIRKDIKNMHLAVYPPTGRIRLSVPQKADPEMLRLFAISKLGWIKKHIKSFNEQPRESKRTFQNGESHYFLGKRFLLNIQPANGFPKVTKSGNKLLLHIKENSTLEERSNVVKEWYRKELKKLVPQLIEKWESEMGVKSNSWGVKIMRTKWGACNTEEKRIWINLELAKKPINCIEYIVVHELVHLLERNHNEKFVKHMDQFMPKWRQYRDELNSLPVAHNDWGY
jgi:predicted metal-dependent hydrolase